MIFWKEDSSANIQQWPCSTESSSILYLQSNCNTFLQVLLPFLYMRWQTIWFKTLKFYFSLPLILFFLTFMFKKNKKTTGLNLKRDANSLSTKMFYLLFLMLFLMVSLCLSLTTNTLPIQFSLNISAKEKESKNLKIRWLALSERYLINFHQLCSETWTTSINSFKKQF